MTDLERTQSILKELDVAFISYGNLHDDEEHGCKVIEKALKKQVPMKPFSYKVGFLGEGYEDAFDCPNCRQFFTVYIPGKTGIEGRNNYCDRCGQAIDWSEVK